LLALPSHYWRALVDYYFYLHPPKDNDSTFGDDTVIDFDALTPRKRVQM